MNEYSRDSLRIWGRRMALIEHLERDGWKLFLRDMFQYTLEVLKHDRFRRVGSSVDDLRSWLAAGGVARVSELLDDQMEMRGFSPSRKSAVQDCLEQLAQEHRDTLVHLMAEGTICASTAPLDGGVSAQDIRDFFGRLDAGERPFEDWMHAHGHSDEETAEIYEAIDRWLVQNGIISKPGPLPRSN